mmetsp:Transcript_96305/g.272288  ORF Transcript_96305/g.272288 Transcript_96305/m.272288 type:complete len:375 (-) Transcript_96305:189-1313(-)
MTCTSEWSRFCSRAWESSLLLVCLWAPRRPTSSCSAPSCRAFMRAWSRCIFSAARTLSLSCSPCFDDALTRLAMSASCCSLRSSSSSRASPWPWWLWPPGCGPPVVLSLASTILCRCSKVSKSFLMAAAFSSSLPAIASRRLLAPSFCSSTCRTWCRRPAVRSSSAACLSARSLVASSVARSCLMLVHTSSRTSDVSSASRPWLAARRRSSRSAASPRSAACRSLFSCVLWRTVRSSWESARAARLFACCSMPFSAPETCPFSASKPAESAASFRSRLSTADIVCCWRSWDLPRACLVESCSRSAFARTSASLARSTLSLFRVLVTWPLVDFCASSSWSTLASESPCSSAFWSVRARSLDMCANCCCSSRRLCA